MEVALIRVKKPRGGIPARLRAVPSSGLGFEMPDSTADLDPTSLDDLMPPVDDLTGAIDFGSAADCQDSSLWASNDARLAACFAAPGSTLTTAPLPAQTPADLATQTAQARAANASIGVAMTAAQLVASLASGAVVTGEKIAAGAKAANCPGGYYYPNGQCAPLAPGVKAAGQWFAGVSNQTLLIAGGSLVAFTVLLSMMSGGGGRRRR